MPALTRRIGKVFNWLGLSCAAVGAQHRGLARKHQRATFDADITYVTGQELAFTYLFDNSSTCCSPEEQVWLVPPCLAMFPANLESLCRENLCLESLCHENLCLESQCHDNSCLENSAPTITYVLIVPMTTENGQELVASSPPPAAALSPFRTHRVLGFRVLGF